MNNDTITGPDYLKKLPQAVQDFVLDGVWEDRTLEIGAKYSFTPTQSDMLADQVLYVLIGLESPDGFQERLVKELNISKLLASQIEEDLSNRVFQLAMQTIQAKPKPAEKKLAVTASEPAEVPEVRPETVPAVKTEWVAHSNPVPQQKPGVPTPPTPAAVVVPPAFVPEKKPADIPVISFKPSQPAPPKEPEVKKIFLHTMARDQIQRPVSVPRFAGTAPAPENTTTLKPEGIPSVPPVAAAATTDSKITFSPAATLVKPESAATSAPITPTPPPVPKAPQKYDVDPYLEPAN